MDRVTRLSHQEVAEQVLQIYMKSLQDHKGLKSILAEFCILDYFGKFFCGQDKVASHIITNLHGSSYELATLTVNDQSSFVRWKPESETQETAEEGLGVGLITSPKLVFPSLSLSTPVRSYSQARKRLGPESSQPNCCGNKLLKTDSHDQSSTSKKSESDGMNLNSRSVSPAQQQQHQQQSFQPLFPESMRHLTAYGTIRYPKRVLPTMDPKRIKHCSLVRLRDRFCQLYIGFECDEHVIGVTNCKIWTIKYSVSSRVTPRNLLKSFNEVE